MAKKKVLRQDERTDALIGAFQNVCATEDGILLLRFIRDECGFLLPSTIINPTTGEVNQKSTEYNDAKRDVYLRVRNYIPKKSLIKIEFGDRTDLKQSTTGKQKEGENA